MVIYKIKMLKYVTSPKKFCVFCVFILALGLLSQSSITRVETSPHPSEHHHEKVTRVIIFVVSQMASKLCFWS